MDDTDQLNVIVLAVTQISDPRHSAAYGIIHSPPGTMPSNHVGPRYDQEAYGTPEIGLIYSHRTTCVRGVPCNVDPAKSMRIRATKRNDGSSRCRIDMGIDKQHAAVQVLTPSTSTSCMAVYFPRCSLRYLQQIQEEMIRTYRCHTVR